MKIKKENAFVGVDIIIAIIAIIFFSTLIISMIYSNALENAKLKKETLAMISITEIFENIGIENYENVTEENINNLVPTYVTKNYEVDLTITNQFDDVTNYEDIMKKVQVTLTYDLGNKTYTCSMERMKIKE